MGATSVPESMAAQSAITPALAPRTGTTSDSESIPDFKSYSTCNGNCNLNDGDSSNYPKSESSSDRCISSKRDSGGQIEALPTAVHVHNAKVDRTVVEQNKPEKEQASIE